MKSNTEGWLYVGWPLETSIKLRRHLLWSLHPLGYNSFFSPPFLHLPLTSLMKAYAKELPSGKRTSLENTRKAVLILTATLIVLTIIPLYFYPSSGPSFLWRRSTSPPKPPSPSRDNAYDPLKNIRVIKKCDIFRGEWVPNPNAPYYTNETCWAIHEHQNCMKFGRPDTEFMKWRWKPNDCELPIFNPAQFLELVRGKKLAFVGDSVGRNQMQSLMCLLSRVTYAVDISPTPDEYFKRWSYPTHNFTLANFWSPYLVHAGDADPLHYSLSSLFWLHLDEPDKNWTTQVHEFDYVILSAGHWFFRSTMYFEKNRLVGCHYCQDKNVTDLTMYYGYRMAFRTAFQTLINLEGFKGMVFLRTFAPSHFENGIWNKGGDCIRTRPLRSNETRLDGFNLELYMTQLEEFRAAEREGRKKGLKFRLLDTTEAMLLRPDGHPSRYGHKPNANVLLYNDCVHWCLPGPVDAWNDFLLHMLKMEGGRTSLGRLSQSERKMRIRS